MSTIDRDNRLLSRIDKIPEKSRKVKENFRSIETQIDEMTELYQRTRKRAEQEIPEEYQWQALSETPVEDTSLGVISILDDDTGSLPEPLSRESIEIDADNSEEYVRQLASSVEEKEAVIDELESRIGAAKDLSDEAIKEFIQSTDRLSSYNSPSDALDGSWGEKLDQTIDLANGRRETQRLLEGMITQTEAEKDALKTELKETVDRYTDQIYEQATAIVQRLGGENYRYTGELDLLEKLSRTRATIVDDQMDAHHYRHDSDGVAAHETPLEQSKDALESQADLISRYVANLDQANVDGWTILEEAESVLDQERIESSREQLEDLQNQYEDLGDAFPGRQYNSLAEAVEAVMNDALAEDEELDFDYDFSLEETAYDNSVDGITAQR